jgi:hypothetical protein
MLYRMQIYVFVSIALKVIGFAADMTGGNIPEEYAPWRTVEGGKTMVIIADTDPVARVPPALAPVSPVQRATAWV